MKKLFILLAVAVVALTACNNKLTAEQAEAVVMEGEKEDIPLLVQKFSDVESIVIDSIHLRIIDEPMSGYLYTTWKYVVKKTIYPTVNELMRGIYDAREIEEQREKQVIVEVSNIQHSKERKGYIEWQTDWTDAYRVIRKDMY